MTDFSRRSTQSERMDEPGIAYAVFEDCLRELETINRWTFAYPPTLRWLQRALAESSDEPRTLLDIGSGGGDMLRRMHDRLGKKYPGLRLTGVDINPWSRRAAETHPSNPAIAHETRDIFAFEADRQADFIVSSLFTHHLDDDALVAFLRWMERHARGGWFINDLHRHPLPYHFIRLATRLLSRNPLIRHDAAVSVARAFTRRDWQALLAQAGISTDVRIRWHFPFRYCLARRKPAPGEAG